MVAMVDWVKGEVDPRDFILKENGAALDLTGHTVILDLVDRNGVAVNTAGNVAVITPQTGADKGRVRFTPDANDLQPAVDEAYVSVTLYDSSALRHFVRRARFKVSGPSFAGNCPRGEPDLWRVYER